MIKHRIYFNMLYLFAIVISYICLLCFISNEGLKNPLNVPGTVAVDEETAKLSIPVQDINLNEIQINKNLINVE